MKVDGLVKKPADYQFEDLIKPHKLEDRIYRFRCVEAWSMVIPWQGIPLAEMIKRFEPLPSAKFVQFTTVMAPDQMPGQRIGDSALAVRRRPAHGRSDASADAHGRRASTARRCRTRTARRSG